MMNSVAVRATALRDKAAAGTSSAPAASDSGDSPFVAELPDEPMRFRWGVSAGAGTFIPGPNFALGAEARAGWQFNRIFSAYLSFGGIAGFSFGGALTSGGASLNIGGNASYAIGAQAEAVFEDMFFIAGGPHLARGAWGFIAQSADATGGVSQRVLAAGGDWMPAVNLKVGLGLGSRNEKTGRRNHFIIALDTMFLFAPNTVTGTQVVNMNGVNQSVEVRGVAVGVAPLIVIGFDGR